MKKQTKALNWIIKNSKLIFAKLAVIILLSVALALFGVVLAWVSREVIDVATGQMQGSFAEKGIKLLIVIAVQLILQSISSNITTRATGRLSMHLKKTVFTMLMKKDWQSVSTYHSGDLLNRINGDVNVITGAVINIIPSFLSLVTRLAAGFTMLFALDPVFAGIILVLGPIVIVFVRIYSKKMKTLHKKCQESDGKISSFMQESMQNLLMIKSFSGENYMSEKSDELQEAGYKLKIKRNTISIFANIGLYLCFSAGFYIALVWGAYRLALGEISYGTMTMFLQLINQVQTPFLSLSGLLPQYYSAIASAERIIELENLPNEHYGSEAVEAEKLYKSLKSIKVNNISFAYDCENVLENACCEIKKGEFAAIAGTSGVGKSTLLKLLLGIITPSEGEIVLETNEKTITADKSTRKIFSYVPQGNMILSGTIRDNIRFAKSEASDDEIIRCARLAEIWDFIEELPDGLDTVLGERGVGLSEGQVQRIAIARALLYDSPILLLDESTSALDEATEAAVLTNLKSIKSKTCIIISHKKAALEICDKIIAIKDGKIVNY